MSLSGRSQAVLLAILTAWISPASRADAPKDPEPAVPTAFVGVNVVPMDQPRVLAGYSVLVEGGRIVALGPAAEVAVPPGARVVEGRGRYLLPGLVDMHVHLDRRLGSRPDFGDAPLYLADGVTTVLNLRGDEEILALRRRVAAGELLGPALLTSGDFINEPRVTTPEEIEQEVERQAAAGFDVLKFHEVFDLETRAMLTTRGLSREAYRHLIESARRRGMLLLGHVPERFGIEAALAERQSLAHANAYLFSYFWPHQTPTFQVFRWLSVVAAGALAVTALLWLGIAVARLLRPGAEKAFAARPVALALLGLVTATTAWLAWRELAWLDWLGRGPHLRGLTAAGLFLLLLVAATCWLGVKALRQMEKRPMEKPAVRVLAVATIAAALALSASLAYWLPLVRRSSERGLDRIAAATARSGIWVATTLTVENVFTPVERPEVRFLVPKLEERWRQFTARADPARVERARRGIGFFQRLAGALHRAGVPLLAGTDAMGFPWMIPGASLHEELGLLAGAGLTPYEALRTATVNPAAFLGRERELGSLEVGKRADLLLVDGDPLQDLAHLRDPAGVMVAGRWLPREELAAMLKELE